MSVSRVWGGGDAGEGEVRDAVEDRVEETVGATWGLLRI